MIEDEPFRNAETLLKIWLLGNKLNVIELEDDWAWALLRLRADGRIEEPIDLYEFEVENVARVEHLPYYLETTMVSNRKIEGVCYVDFHHK